MKGAELVIPKYTAEDYLSSTAPYEYLYDFRDNKLRFSQMREKMKMEAAKIGVKGFIGLWKSYLEMVSPKEEFVNDNVTDFVGQELELVCGKYICDDYGVFLTDKYGYEIEICPHPIMPVERLVNVDTGAEYLKLAYRKGHQWRSVIEEKTTINSATKILGLGAFGVYVNSENAKALCSYLMKIEELNLDVIPEYKSVARLGWVGNHGFSPYVDGLVFDGDQSFKHIFNAVRTEGNFDEWKNIMVAVRKSGIAGRLFLAASFASVIVDVCGINSFFVHAWGGTEVGKTVGLMIAASVWGNPKMGEYITTFNSTSVAQELQASFLNSLPMCLDELQIQSSQGIKDFDKIIYMLTEGVGKSRGAKTGGLQKNNTWRNCIITNGEHPISNANSGGGALNRVIEFECTEKVYPDLVQLCSVIQNNYGFAGKRFVEFLQYENGKESAQLLRKYYYNELLKGQSTDKQAASASALLAADHLVTELIFQDDNNLTVDDMQKIMTHKDEVNVNLRALEFAFELVARNPNKFKPNDFGEYQGEVWGAVEADKVYIIKSVFDRELKNEGFNATAFLSWAQRNGYLECDDGRKTKKKRVKGFEKSMNCICLLQNKNNGILTFETNDIEDYCGELPN